MDQAVTWGEVAGVTGIVFGSVVVIGLVLLFLWFMAQGWDH